MQYFQMIMALIGVLALVFLLFWIMKKLNKRGYIGSNGKNIKILERVPLGQDRSLLLVSVCGKCMVLGVTGSHTEKICDIEQTEEELTAIVEAEKNENPTFAQSFKTVLGNMFDKKK